MIQRRRGALHAYVAATNDADILSIVFVDARARVLDHIALAASDASTACARALRGIVYALWRSRRLGYRRVAVHSDVPGAVTRLNGERPLEPSLIGPYLEARALMRAYRWARVDVGELRWRHAPVPVTGVLVEQLSILPRDVGPAFRSHRVAEPCLSRPWVAMDDQALSRNPSAR
ncbi:MAG TPA: hypothetical protein VEP50_11595 [bacterium]|nr:hypothetical protein [bacterium]